MLQGRIRYGSIGQYVDFDLSVEGEPVLCACKMHHGPVILPLSIFIRNLF